MLHRSEKKFGGRRLLQVLAAGSCVSLSLASNLADMRSSGNKAMKEVTVSRRTASNTEECKENLLAASSKYGFMFTKDAYLDFIGTQSNGSIVKTKFDSSFIGLAFEYWNVMCKVNADGCTNNIDISVYDVINYSDDGSDLISEFCARVNGVLEDLGVSPPTNLPTAMDAPTRSPVVPVPSPRPSISPTKTPTLSPMKAPTRSPTDEPTLAPTRSPTKAPSGSPSLAPVPLASEPPTPNPSPSPTVEKFDLSQCSVYENVWNFDQVTNNGNCKTAVGLIAEGRITCNSECPADCIKCKQCLSKHRDCPTLSPSPTLSSSPTSSPTKRDSFTLTFSVGYNINNPKEVITEWTEDLIFEELAIFDTECTKTSCPITSNVSTTLNVQNCNSFSPPIEADECALADLNVAISSTDPFLEGIIKTIEKSVREKISAELGERLSPKGITLLVEP